MSVIIVPSNCDFKPGYDSYTSAIPKWMMNIISEVKIKGRESTSLASTD